MKRKYPNILPSFLKYYFSHIKHMWNVQKPHICQLMDSMQNVFFPKCKITCEINVLTSEILLTKILWQKKLNDRKHVLSYLMKKVLCVYSDFFCCCTDCFICTHVSSVCADLYVHVFECVSVYACMCFSPSWLSDTPMTSWSSRLSKSPVSSPPC